MTLKCFIGLRNVTLQTFVTAGLGPLCGYFYGTYSWAEYKQWRQDDNVLSWSVRRWHCFGLSSVSSLPNFGVRDYLCSALSMSYPPSLGGLSTSIIVRFQFCAVRRCRHDQYVRSVSSVSNWAGSQTCTRLPLWVLTSFCSSSTVRPAEVPLK